MGGDRPASLFSLADQLGYKASPWSDWRLGIRAPDVIESRVQRVYRIYHSGLISLEYPNKLPMKGGGTRFRYLYYDADGTEHFVCETSSKVVRRHKNGSPKSGEPPPGYVQTYSYPTGGNAKKAYVYGSGEIYATGSHRNATISYAADEGHVTLVKMLNSLPSLGTKSSVAYDFTSTQRRYCEPGAYAAFIGALARSNVGPVHSTGMCFEDGTSYPSLTHPNGDSVDTLYLPSAKLEQRLIDALLAFGFTKIYRGQGWELDKKGNKKVTIEWLGQLTGATYKAHHEDHLHAGEFDSSRISTA